MAGLRAEANLGSWTFNLGRLGEASAPLPQIGVSYTKRFFTNYDLSRAANPFKGVAVGPPPPGRNRPALYLDDSPEDGGGALIFRTRVWVDGQLRYDIAGGKEPPGILKDEQNASRIDAATGGGGRAADGTAVFSYVIPLFNAQEIQSVEIAVEAANDYRIEALTPPEYPSGAAQFERKAQAVDNIKDGSNRATERFFFGSLTDESTLGIDLQTSFLGLLH